MSFLYSIFLKLLYPTSLCLLCLLAMVVLRKRRIASRVCLGLAAASFLICGNGWLVEGLTKNLERQYPALEDYGTTSESRNWESRNLKSKGTTDRRTEGRGQRTEEVSSQRSVVSSPATSADAILVLSGGILPALPPRSTVEIAEAGDRLLYGAYLFRQGKAPGIICTGNVATGGLARRPVAEDMAEFLQLLGIPKDSILTEVKSENTYQHAAQLSPIFEQRGFKRVLLVTSALHMPRSMGVFKRQCPGIEFIPAPTDFRVTEKMPAPWYRQITYLIPTPSSLLLFSEAMHEYLGIVYYRVRGWM